MTELHEEDRTHHFVPLAEGTMVSHFRLSKRIGAGGMGEVYLAEDTQLDRQVALKFLPAQYSNDIDLKNRFQREARAAAKLNHPNIITIYEVSEFNGRPYFAMEYVEGKSLHTHVQDTPLQVSQILALAIQIGEGLRRAHEQGIIHRDIKSANVIVGSDGRARLLDFGLAAVHGSEKLTRDGSTLGTVAYMSPEQIRGQAVDHRSDLFSFGVVLYELVTGRTPFRRDNDASTMNAINTEAAEPLARFKVGVPPSLQQVIDKALQKDPSMRYQSAGDFVADMKRIQSETSSPSLPVMPSSKPIVAVLPFENAGSAEREYFADGITDEVIARLARLKEIGVIAEASVAQYKKSTKRPREIGQELGCGYILRGNVRWDESAQPPRVRISAKLTRVQDETYLWAESYDRVLDQIFVVQSDIADHVARELGASLSSGKQADPSAGGTKNLEAYDLYLRAREFFPGTIDDTLIRQTITLLRQTLALDPDYASALALLGWAEIAQFWVTDKEPSRLAAAKEHLERALALAPGLFDAHVGMGYYHYWGRLDYEPALEEFGKALALRPNDADVLFSIGVVERRQGKIEQSIERLNLAMRLNPRAHLILWNQSQSLTFVGRYREGVELAEKAVQMNPASPAAWSTLAYAAATAESSLEAGAKILARAEKHVQLSRLLYLRPLMFIYAAFHGNDFGKALDSLDVTSTGPDPLSFVELRYVLAHAAGRKDVARLYAEVIVAIGEDRIQRETSEVISYVVLAEAYCELGMPDKARERAQAIEQMRTFKIDAFERAVCCAHLVNIYGRLGDLETGLSWLRRFMQAFRVTSPGLYSKMPVAKYYAHLPEFWEILGIERPNQA